MSIVSTIPITGLLGPVTTPAASVPNTATGGDITLDGTTMTNPALRVSVSIDFSPDGGVTWAATSPGPAMNPFPVIATFNGGSLDKAGHPAATYGVGATFPPGVNRKVRGTFLVDGVALTTTATISLVP